jgi:hypothetical protein
MHRDTMSQGQQAEHFPQVALGTGSLSGSCEPPSVCLQGSYRCDRPTGIARGFDAMRETTANSRRRSRNRSRFGWHRQPRTLCCPAHARAKSAHLRRCVFAHRLSGCREPPVVGTPVRLHIRRDSMVIFKKSSGRAGQRGSAWGLPTKRDRGPDRARASNEEAPMNGLLGAVVPSATGVRTSRRLSTRPSAWRPPSVPPSASWWILTMSEWPPPTWPRRTPGGSPVAPFTWTRIEHHGIERTRP